jgi:hypothetical protein
MPTEGSTMTRRAFLEAAATASDLLADPAVASVWDAPSALQEMSVRGLAGHLARQIFHVTRVLAQGRSDEQPITLFEHYVRSDWRDADVDDDANVGIRRDAEREATSGPEALAAQARTTVDDLRRVLPAQPADLVVYLPWGPWALSLDDFLTTRMLEIAIHTDDLAVSVGVDTPALPAAVIDPVVGLLASLAVQRHGATAVLRALSRAERAPATIAAI